MPSYKASAAITRPRIPAVEAPIWRLVAALPVEDAEAAASDGDVGELSESEIKSV